MPSSGYGWKNLRFASCYFYVIFQYKKTDIASNNDVINHILKALKRSDIIKSRVFPLDLIGEHFFMLAFKSIFHENKEYYYYITAFSYTYH